MKKILVVGSINMDCVIRLPRRPRPGETVFCSTVSHVPGGKGANQAYALGRMGTGVSLIGAVGQDEFGRISLANLRAAGVDTTGVRVSADEDTGRAFIEVEDDGQNSIIVLGGANTHVTEQDLLAHEALFDRCEALIMQLETPLDTVTAAARLARRKGKLVLLDPADVGDGGLDDLALDAVAAHDRGRVGHLAVLVAPLVYLDEHALRPPQIVPI